MTSHLQITFPAAISQFPEIFTSFHTTFHVHNNKWHHFWDSALELGSWPPFHRSPEHFTPLVTHLGTCKLCTSSSASFAYMAHPGYHHIVSIAPYLSNFAGWTIKYTVETFWSMSTHDKLCTNKIWKQNAHFSQFYRINKVVGIAKPAAKIDIAIFYRTGYPRWDYQRDSPTSKLWGVRIGESHCFLWSLSGKGHCTGSPCPSPWCTSTCLRWRAQFVRWRQMFTCGSCIYTLDKVGTKQNFEASHHTAENFDQTLTKPCCVLWILTVNNLPLFDPWR